MKAVGENKRCSKCREWKNVADFSRKAEASDGLNTKCRSCAAADYKKYRDSNREAILEKSREKSRTYYTKNKSKIQAKARLLYKEQPERFDEINIKSREKKQLEYQWMKEKLLELGVQV